MENRIKKLKIAGVGTTSLSILTPIIKTKTYTAQNVLSGVERLAKQGFR